MDNIALGGGEKRNVNASLQVGTTNQTVEVSGTADIITPVDSGEKANTLTTRQLENYVQVGSNAAEYLKIMPGFGNNNGASNKANYSGQTIGINANGDAGSQSPLNNSFSYNGLPGNTLDIVADGAHVSDPGLQLRHAGESELRFPPGVQGAGLELQRGEPEGPDGHYLRDEGGRQLVSTATAFSRPGITPRTRMTRTRTLWASNSRRTSTTIRAAALAVQC